MQGYEFQVEPGGPKWKDYVDEVRRAFPNARVAESSFRFVFDTSLNLAALESTSRFGPFIKAAFSHFSRTSLGEELVPTGVLQEMCSLGPLELEGCFAQVLCLDPMHSECCLPKDVARGLAAEVLKEVLATDMACLAFRSHAVWGRFFYDAGYDVMIAVCDTCDGRWHMLAISDWP